MKSTFRVPGSKERVLQFHGWHINSEFRISFLEACAYNNVSLSKASKLAEIDLDTLTRFMKGEDGLLEYIEMQRLIKAVSPHIAFITVAVGVENITCNSPSPDELREGHIAGSRDRLDFSWKLYNERGTIPK